MTLKHYKYYKGTKFQTSKLDSIRFKNRKIDWEMKILIEIELKLNSIEF